MSEKYLKEIAKELNLIRRELEKNNSKAANVTVNNPESEDSLSFLKKQILKDIEASKTL